MLFRALFARERRVHRTAGMRRVPLRTGDAVTIRGERWRVAAESPFENVSIIDVDGCDATLQQGKQDCAQQCGCTLGSGCQSNCCNDQNSCYNTCLDPKQVDSFVCRDNCRESFHDDEQLQENIKNCRASFRACVQACPPAQ